MLISLVLVRVHHPSVKVVDHLLKVDGMLVDLLRTGVINLRHEDVQGKRDFKVGVVRTMPV